MIAKMPFAQVRAEGGFGMVVPALTELADLAAHLPAFERCA
jgi:hypothetical protein